MTESERRHSFFHQPVGRRAAIVAAGPLANFILAIVIFAAIFTVYGKQITSARVERGAAGFTRRRRGFQARRRGRSRSMAAASRASLEMQRIVSAMDAAVH